MANSRLRRLRLFGYGYGRYLGPDHSGFSLGVVSEAPRGRGACENFDRERPGFALQGFPDGDFLAQGRRDSISRQGPPTVFAVECDFSSSGSSEGGRGEQIYEAGLKQVSRDQRLGHHSDSDSTWVAR